MALDPDIFDQAQRMFCQEAMEHLAVLEAEILALRQEISPNRIHVLMRASHNLKGGAASFGWDGIAAIAHRLELVFQGLFDHGIRMDPELETLLLRAFSYLRDPLLSQIQTGSHELETEAAAETFSMLNQRLKSNRDPGHLPSSIELGLDIVRCLFEQDVEIGLTHLEQVTEDSSGHSLAEEWRAQLELLRAIGEMSGLSGFTALTQTIELALGQQAQIKEGSLLLQQALVDLRAAQAQVLGGDREIGGSPSEALLAWVKAGDPSEESLAELESLFGSLDIQEKSQDLPSDLAVEAMSIEEDLVWPSEADNAPDYKAEVGLDFSALELVFEQDPESEMLTSQGDPTERWLDVDPVTYEIFTQEARDLLATIEAGLLELRQQDFSPQQFQTLMRAAHSIKGGAALVGLPEITTVAHQLENVFQALYHQQLVVDPQLEDLLLRAFDSLRIPLLQQIQQGFYHPEQTLEQAAEVFAQLEQRLEYIASAEVDPEPMFAYIEATREDPQPELATAMPLQDPVVPVLPQQVVRVDLSRLERINNRIGELVTQENSLFLHNDALTGILRTTQQRTQQFERFSRSFQDALDSLTLHSQRSQGSSSDQGFDPLQMDRYSRIHILMQEAVEEMLQLEEAFLDMSHFTQQSQHTLKRHRQTLKQVRDELIWARMLPLKDLVQRFPRMVRDLASQLNKSANLVVTGADTLIDKGILEKLYDPLVHLIRNSLDHGIETPDQRITLGKPPSGTIEIRAYYQGNQTCIEIRDDGNGIPIPQVIDKGIQQGLITAAEAKTFTPQQAYELLFSPGFSTASHVTDISGRGVGLDVVRLQVQKLKGLIEVDSQPQRGTTFTIRLPLTLTVARLLIMVTEAGLLAFPIDDVVSVVAAPAQDLIEQDPISDQAQDPTNRSYLWQEQRIPVYALSEILPYRYPVLVDSRDPIAALTLPDNTAPPLVLVRRGSQVVALQVGGLLREQELVIKPPSRALTPPPYLYGCSALGDGRLVPVLDPATLLVASGKGSTTSVRLRLAQSDLPTVLIADDSPTMRQTLSSSLRKAGYRVTQARDGQEALDFLHRDPQVRAVICDIEMPQMNGFEFLSSCRQAQLQVPVIMLTSRGSSKHRQLAQQLGAVDYLTKPFLEQDLRAAIQRCLAQPPDPITARNRP